MIGYFVHVKASTLVRNTTSLSAWTSHDVASLTDNEVPVKVPLYFELLANTQITVIAHILV